jgi:hypothetical protein
MTYLSADDLKSIGDTPITIRSTYFSNVYLRMDGTGVAAPANAGGGMVNCQYGVPDAREKFKVHPQADGSVSLESLAFPGVYLRMDGTGMTSFNGVTSKSSSSRWTARRWACDATPGTDLLVLVGVHGQRGEVLQPGSWPGSCGVFRI